MRLPWREKMRIKILPHIVIGWLALFCCFSCVYTDSDHGAKGIDDYFTIKVSISSDAEVVPPSSVNQAVDYPGVTAERITDRVEVFIEAVSLEGRQVSFFVKNITQTAMPRGWLVMKEIDSSVELVSEPDTLNQDNEQIFVFGPLGPQESDRFELEFELISLVQDYFFRFDLLSVSPRLVYTANPEEYQRDDLYSINFYGNDNYRVRVSKRRDLDAAWSPGMELIAFESFEDNSKFQIYTMHPDGSNLNIITGNTPEHSSFEPTFSPDGKHLAYNCENRTPGSSRDICINTVRGDDERVIAEGTGWYQDQVFWPTWSPDGTRILYCARHAEKYNRHYFFVQNIDPHTMELDGPPVKLNEVYPGDTLDYINCGGWDWPTGPGGEIDIFFIDSKINWAPDSKHGVAMGRIVKYDCPGWPRNRCTFRGVTILDLEGMINDGPRVYPLPYARLLYNYDKNIEEIESPCFHPRLNMITHQHNYLTDGRNVVVNIMLDDNYEPFSLEEIPILEGYYIIMSPAWPPPLLPDFYR
jgi:hypothetical protein